MRNELGNSGKETPGLMLEKSSRRQTHPSATRSCPHALKSVPQQKRNHSITLRTALIHPKEEQEEEEEKEKQLRVDFKDSCS
jgi:hypothetical protein